MQTSPVRLIDYFDGTKQSVIPLFQRKYSWTKKLWDRLWDDLIELAEDGPRHPHFMGAIVSVPTQTVPVGVNKSLIIDGQQRLTTIALLLCALRKHVDELDSARISERLTNRLYAGVDELKLLPTQGDRDIFLKLVKDQSIAGSDHAMVRAYKYFLKKLDQLPEEHEGTITPKTVMEALESHLRVVMINLDKDDDPYVIFETLNYIGEPLTHADLVRNFVLMKFTNSFEGGVQERVYLEKWVPMEERLGDKLTTFLMHYGRKDGLDVRKTTIYSSFKERFELIKTMEETEAEISELSKHSTYYQKFLYPEKEPASEVRTRLEAFESLDMSSHYPILLKIYAAWDEGLASESEVIKCLDYLESYLVRRAVVGLPNNAVDLLFIQVAGAVDPANLANSIFERLMAATGRTRWPSDPEFEQAILTQQQYPKKSTPYVLRRLEESFGHKEGVDLNAMQLEHIMPQVLSSQWEIDLGEDANSVSERLKHVLGNLTLTGYNPELGNKSFAEKKAIYRESHIELNKWITNRTAWNEPTIMERGSLLAAQCIKLWPQR